ncbi:MAG: hypothetical protein CL677_08460 [Bdellovibrionaceae bacterium]|nr:hypothetical protein [Pseudobdellovibrionaceae bacterium]|tara:strand:+ start:71558 stop:71857 length:300 start_codon:yes stop_codon:yes gene_type:complete
MAHVIQSAQTYTKTLFILLFLTVVTVAVSYVDLGQGANTFVALAVASVKAYFVGATFMNLKHSGPTNIAIFVVSVFFLAVLYIFSVADIWTRVIHAPVL